MMAEVPSINDPVAFKAWPADYKVKRQEFHSQCVVGQYTADQVKAMHLQDFFSPEHMKAMWQEYARHTKPAMKQPAQNLHADASKSKKESKLEDPRKVKNQMLALSVAMPGTWEDHLVEYIETIEDKRTDKKESEWMFYGEFERYMVARRRRT